jgi:beta-galactosidase
MNIKVFLLALLTAFPVLTGSASPSSGPRQRLQADLGWKFLMGDLTNAQNSELDDRAWRPVDLPHDWSIEGKFDRKNPMGGAGGFLPAGVGWYRRTFTVPGTWRGKQVWAEFEGVYMNSQVWLNGVKLGGHPYGYTTFAVDLTSALKPGRHNVLAVRVDNSQHKNTRWYSGSGIYRHVWLTVADPVHVAPWGVFVRTLEAHSELGKVALEIQVTNASTAASLVTLHTSLFGPDGKQAGESQGQSHLAAGTTTPFSQSITVRAPALWSPPTPQLYRAVTEVQANGKTLDRVETPFGIRTLAWSVDHGLQLNGNILKLYGGCFHDDSGCLGVASFDRAEERRVEELLAAGFNAVRTSHNPPAPAFLDACDRLGLLVMDEAFDCWNVGKNSKDYHLVFKDWWQRDLEAMVRRDRNHPSIIFWSIGNEIPEAFQPLGADTGQLLADWVRKFDTTRPVTEAILGRPRQTQLETYDRHSAALDITGYNYAINSHAADHQRVPTRVMVSTESNPHDVFQSWAVVNDNSYVLGDFMWTAIDYLGEAGIGRWAVDASANGHGGDAFFPSHGAYCGDIDLMGVRKPVSHYRNIVWDRGEKLYLTVQQPVLEGHKINIEGWAVYPTSPSWTWPGFEEKPVKVEVYSRADSVQLFQDDHLIGEKKTGRDQQFKAVFDVTYRPGKLRAVALQDGQKTDEKTLETVDAPAALRVTADRSTLAANGQDLLFATVEIVDRKGRWQPNAEPELTFAVDGASTFAGAGSGDVASTESYQSPTRKAFQGRAQVVLRSKRKAGSVTLHVRAKGLPEATLIFKTQTVPQPSLLP